MGYITLFNKIICLALILTCIFCKKLNTQQRDCQSGESQCNPDAAPFTCLTGSAKGGCTADASFWPKNGCAEQCKASKNPNSGPKPTPTPTPGPKPTPTPVPKPGAEQRDCQSGESQCNPDAAPFTCLSGSAKGGCTADASFWPKNGCANQCKATKNPNSGPKPTPTPTPGPKPTPTPGPRPAGGKRTFLLKNHSKQDLYMAVYGDPATSSPLAKGDGGFLLRPGQDRSVLVGPKFSGRVWARTGCKRVQKKGGGKPALGTPMGSLEDCKSSNDDDCLLACDTGNCKASNGLAGEVECSVSGETPVSVIELTLGGYGGNDFYDLSNVDGFSIGMSIKAFNFKMAPGVPEPYNCKAPVCNIKESISSWCPPELQVKTKSGVYCTSICKALEHSHIQQVDNTKQYTVPSARNFKGTAKQYLEFLRESEDFMPNAAPNGKMIDRLCCQCGKGSGGCEDLSKPCTYGCSPFVTNYGPEYKHRKCPAIYDNEKKHLIETPDWPLSTLGTNFADIFKDRCRQTYSWQFNDSESTFQCQEADYELIFD